MMLCRNSLSKIAFKNYANHVPAPDDTYADEFQYFNNHLLAIHQKNGAELDNLVQTQLEPPVQVYLKTIIQSQRVQIQKSGEESQETTTRRILKARRTQL